MVHLPCWTVLNSHYLYYFQHWSFFCCHNTRLSVGINKWLQQISTAQCIYIFLANFNVALALLFFHGPASQSGLCQYQQGKGILARGAACLMKTQTSLLSVTGYWSGWQWCYHSIKSHAVYLWLWRYWAIDIIRVKQQRL